MSIPIMDALTAIYGKLDPGERIDIAIGGGIVRLTLDREGVTLFRPDLGW